jgi:decaprenylphospho-beta-D-erythro-pentofuranosid-2-ulose 2-reductase
MGATRAVELILVARNVGLAERIAIELRARNGQVEISVETLDFLSTNGITAAVARWTAYAPVDMVLIAHGVLSPQQPCQEDIKQAQNSIDVNGVCPVLFAEAFAGAMSPTGRGTIEMIGSVAGAVAGGELRLRRLQGPDAQLRPRPAASLCRLRREGRADQAPPTRR